MVCKAVNLVFCSTANLVYALASFKLIENLTMNLNIWPKEKPYDLINKLMSVPNFNNLSNCVKSKMSQNIEGTILLCTA